MKVYLSSALLLVFSMSAQAALMETKVGNKEIEDVKLSESAKLTIGTRSYEMKPLGAGLRYKKVAFLTPNVYVAEFFSPEPNTFSYKKSEALESIGKMKAVGVKLTFLRSVGPDQIIESFTEALKKNGIDVSKDAEMKKALDGLRGFPKTEDGSVITVVGEKLPTGGEIVAYEDSKGQTSTVSGSNGFVAKLFSVWLGNDGGDKGIQNLQKMVGLKE